MNFLRYYLRFENSDLHTIFEEEVKKITQSNQTMGIEELLLDRAHKQGMAEKEREKNTVFTRRLLQSTTFSTAQIAELVGVSEDFVEQVRADLESDR